MFNGWQQLKSVTNEGMPIPCCDSCRYLEVYLIWKKNQKANFDQAQSIFYRDFIGIMAKIGRSASNIALVHLLRSKCLPIVLYGTEAFNPATKVVESLDYVITCVFF